MSSEAVWHPHLACPAWVVVVGGKSVGMFETVGVQKSREVSFQVLSRETVRRGASVYPSFFFF